MHWFERESLQRVRQFVRPGMIVVDVGAHIGYYTRLLSELVVPTGQVLAFKPNPANFTVLQHNAAGSKYKNVRLFNCAVADRDCAMPLYISPGHSNHSLMKGYTNAERLLSVKCVTLDSILEEEGIERIDFIKSDTEGAEPLVIAGMQRTIACSPHLRMLLELNPAALRCGNVAPDELLERLQKMGFNVEMVPSDPATKAIYGNILCWKPKHRTAG